MKIRKPEPQLPFKEPEFKSLDDFLTYCSIFDPTILTKSGRLINPISVGHKQIYRDEVIIDLFNDELSRFDEELEDCILFVCDAPFYCEKPKEYSFEIIEQIFPKNPKVNTSWEELRKSQIHSFKTYACWQGSFNNEQFQSWLILKAPAIKNIEYGCREKNMMGYGKTLPEADLEFHKARIKSFTNSQRTINYFIEQKAPLTKQRMFDICKEFDPDVNPNTVTFTYNEFSYIESSNFQLSCQSKKHKFTIYVEGRHITWEVVRTIVIGDGIDVIEYEIYPVNLKFFGEGKTLKEAFDICESEYQESIDDDECLSRMIKAEELQEEIMRKAREGETLYNLIEELGEDIFPDCD